MKTLNGFKISKGYLNIKHEPFLKRTEIFMLIKEKNEVEITMKYHLELQDYIILSHTNRGFSLVFYIHTPEVL